MTAVADELAGRPVPAVPDRQLVAAAVRRRPGAGWPPSSSTRGRAAGARCAPSSPADGRRSGPRWTPPATGALVEALLAARRAPRLGQRPAAGAVGPVREPPSCRHWPTSRPASTPEGDVNSRRLPRRGPPLRGAHPEALAEPPREGARRGEPEQLRDVGQRVPVGREVALGQRLAGVVHDRRERLPLRGQLAVQRPLRHPQAAGDLVGRAPAEGSSISTSWVTCPVTVAAGGAPSALRSWSA